MNKSTITFGSKNEFSETEIIYILNLCEEELSSPSLASITQVKEVKEVPVASYLDENVLKMFSRNKFGIGYESEYEKPSVRITKTEGSGVINIPLIKKDEYLLTKKIALSLIKGLHLERLVVSPVNFKSFFREHYRGNRRTSNFSGLYWLQYYGAEEFARQGGKAILDNPYIEAQLIKDSVFIQVGKSPYDIHTPEGKALMIKANAAMPPVVKD